MRLIPQSSIWRGSSQVRSSQWCMHTVPDYAIIRISKMMFLQCSLCQRHPTQDSIACLMISLLLRLHSPLRLRALLSAAAEPLLDALGDAYAAGCEGSCFYALQSCMNHSCDPNTHAYSGPVSTRMALPSSWPSVP